ncbi:MAG: polymer-forming cytoskeletal protein [candidate division Zixibacteria bacterium]|nr:polymer-forming cytoskeletal protein [candidate division Zixibacteria bacterium]
MREALQEESNKFCNFLHSKNDIYNGMVKRLFIYALAALFLTAGSALAQDTGQTAARKKTRSSPSPPKVTIQNDSVRVIVGEDEIIVETPSGKTKAIPIPPEEALQMSRLKVLEAQKKYEKSGFVLGDSVFLEEPPEVEKSYRARISSGDRVAFGRTVRVEENEEITGDVVAIFGRAEIEGKVNGDVVVPFGSVYLGPRAEVNGDLVSGHLDKAEGAVIHGDLVTVGMSTRGLGVFKGTPPALVYKGKRYDFDDGGPFSNPPIFLIVTLLSTGILLLIYILTWALVPQRVETVRNQVMNGFLKSFLIGFLGMLSILPVFILLLVTIIGIPVALIVLPLALILATLLGDTSICLAVGERIKKTLNFTTDSKIFLIAAGLLVLELPFLLGALPLAMEGAAAGMGIFLLVFGCLLNLVLWMVGFGAVILTRYGGRAKLAAAAAAPPAAPMVPQPSTPPAGA